MHLLECLVLVAGEANSEVCAGHRYDLEKKPERLTPKPMVSNPFAVTSTPQASDNDSRAASPATDGEFGSFRRRGGPVVSDSEEEDADKGGSKKKSKDGTKSIFASLGLGLGIDVQVCVCVSCHASSTLVLIDGWLIDVIRRRRRPV